MSRARSRNSGLAMIMLIVAIAVAVILVSVVSAMVTQQVRVSSRYACSVRARALAEGGIEAALEPLGREEAPSKPVTLAMTGGACLVTITPDAGDAALFTIASEGRLRLAGGAMQVTIRMTVCKGADGLVVRSRAESSRYVQTGAEKGTVP